MEWPHADKPTDQQIKQIEDLANEKIRQNVEIQVLQMERFLNNLISFAMITDSLLRNEAEAKFKDGVNETFLYDKLPVPKSVSVFNVVHIDGW